MQCLLFCSNGITLLAKSSSSNGDRSCLDFWLVLPYMGNMGEVVIQVVYLDFAGARSWTPVQSFLRPKLAGAGNITYQNVPAHFTAVYSKSNGYLGSENTVQLGHWAVALKGFFPSYKKARICYYFMIGGCPTSETLTDPVNKGDVVLRPLLSFTWPVTWLCSNVHTNNSEEKQCYIPGTYPLYS